MRAHEYNDAYSVDCTQNCRGAASVINNGCIGPSRTPSKKSARGRYRTSLRCSPSPGHTTWGSSHRSSPRHTAVSQRRTNLSSGTIETAASSMSSPSRGSGCSSTTSPSSRVEEAATRRGTAFRPGPGVPRRGECGHQARHLPRTLYWHQEVLAGHPQLLLLGGA